MAWLKWGLACCALLQVAFADEWVQVTPTSPFAVYGVTWGPDNMEALRVSQSDTVFSFRGDSSLLQVWYGYVELPEDRELGDLTSFGFGDSITWIHASPWAGVALTVNPLDGPVWNDSVAVDVFECNFWRVWAGPTSGEGTVWFDMSGPPADSFAVTVRRQIPDCRWFAMGAYAPFVGDTFRVHPEDYVVNWRFHTDDVTINPITASPQLAIYPNPANSWFVLSGAFRKPEDVVIYNLLGQKVFEIDLNKPMTRIEAPWPTGLYFVQVGNAPPLRLHLLR